MTISFVHIIPNFHFLVKKVKIFYVTDTKFVDCIKCLTNIVKGKKKSLLQHSAVKYSSGDSKL